MREGGREREQEKENRKEQQSKRGNRVEVGEQEIAQVLHQQVCDSFYTCLILLRTSNNK